MRTYIAIDKCNKRHRLLPRIRVDKAPPPIKLPLSVNLGARIFSLERTPVYSISASFSRPFSIDVFIHLLVALWSFITHHVRQDSGTAREYPPKRVRLRPHVRNGLIFGAINVAPRGSGNGGSTQ